MANRRPAITPVNLGSADRFDRSIFPVSLSNSEALAIGEAFLRDTVDVLLSIPSTCTSLRECKDFAKMTHSRYAELMQEKARLENRTKTPNPFKEFANFRALRIFYHATKLLFIETRITSELMVGSLDPASVSIPRAERHSVSEKSPIGPTIKGTITSGITSDKVIDLEGTIAEACHIFTSNADVSVVNKLMDQLDTLIGGALDPATSQAPKALTRNEMPGHSTASETPSPTTSCTACHSNKLVIKDTLIAPNAIFIGTSLSQGRSHNSGPVRHEVTLPSPPGSS